LKISSSNIHRWLKEELEKNPVHQTIDNGGTFVCPKELPKGIEIMEAVDP